MAWTLGSTLGQGGRDLIGNDSANLYALELYTRSVLGEGQLPHWNPFLLAGTPYLADTQTTVLYPVALLLRWLPPVSFLAWMTAVHLLLAAGGALFLSRVLGLGWFAATAVALAVMTGGNVGPALHNGHLLVIDTTAWLPWVLGLSVLSVRRKGWLPHPGLVLVLVLQVLAGYLQGSIYIVGALCAWFLFSAVWPEDQDAGAARWRPLGQLAVLGAIVLGVSAFQVLPTASVMMTAGRTAGLSYRDAVEGAWTIRDIGRVFFPFVGPDASGSRYLAGESAYVGWMLTCLIPYAFFRRDRRTLVFFGLLALCAIVFAMGDALPFYRLHYALLPGLRLPGRLLFLATLGLAVLGGLGLEQFVSSVEARQWRRMGLAMAVTIVLIVAAASVSLSAAPLADVPPAPGWPWTPVLAVAGLGATGLLTLVGWPRLALVAALGACAIDLVPSFSSSLQRVSVDTVDRHRAEFDSSGPGRAISLCEHEVDVKTMLAARRATLDGIGGVYLRGYAEWGSLVQTGEGLGSTDVLTHFSSDGVLPARRDLLDQANVTAIVACGRPDMPELDLERATGSVQIYRNRTALPRAVWSCGARELPRQVVAGRLASGWYDDVDRLVERRVIHVRWAPAVDEVERVAAERRHGLLNGVLRDGRTWRYLLDDLTPEHGLAIVVDPRVEDTAGLDRATGAVLEHEARSDRGDGPGELLIGAEPCEDAGTVVVRQMDQPDGHVAVDADGPVDGWVFLSEPYFAERQAYVDGRAVTARRANLAFTAVPVSAGRHRVELAYVPRSFRRGVALSGLSLVTWVGLAGWIARRRTQATEQGAHG